MTSKMRLAALVPVLTTILACSPTEPYVLSPPWERSFDIEGWRMARRRYTLDHPTLDERIRLLILDGVVSVGMTKQQVRLTTGRAADFTLTQDLKYGADELWLYRGTAWNGYYYFKGEQLFQIDNGGSLSSEGYPEPTH